MKKVIKKNLQNFPKKMEVSTKFKDQFEVIYYWFFGLNK